MASFWWLRHHHQPPPGPCWYCYYVGAIGWDEVDGLVAWWVGDLLNEKWGRRGLLRLLSAGRGGGRSQPTSWEGVCVCVEQCCHCYKKAVDMWRANAVVERPLEQQQQQQQLVVVNQFLTCLLWTWVSFSFCKKKDNRLDPSSLLRNLVHSVYSCLCSLPTKCFGVWVHLSLCVLVFVFVSFNLNCNSNFVLFLFGFVIVLF